MSLTIQLLGRPQILRDGSPVAGPRGHKTWALLGYLVRADTSPTREVVAGLLFPEADDPLGALRWTLSEVRRLLGSPGSVRGDPVELTLPEGTTVDVDVVISGSWRDALRLPGLGRRFLEGVNPAVGAAFELGSRTSSATSPRQPRASSMRRRSRISPAVTSSRRLTWHPG